MSHNSQALQFDNFSLSLAGDALKPVRFENTSTYKKGEFSSTYAQSLRKQQQTKNTSRTAVTNKSSSNSNKNKKAGFNKNQTTRAQPGKTLPPTKRIRQHSSADTGLAINQQINGYSSDENQHPMSNPDMTIMLAGVGVAFTGGENLNSLATPLNVTLLVDGDELGEGIKNLLGKNADVPLYKNPNKHRDFQFANSTLNYPASSYSQQEGFQSIINHGASKLTASQLTQLPQSIDDVSSGDLNFNAVKDTFSLPRQPVNARQSPTPAFQIMSALYNPAWSNEVGLRLVWMFQSYLQQVQFRLNPKHLGLLEIKISITADQQVNVNFLTHNASVKEALDRAMPRLREAFEQQGMNLSDVNVQQESPRQKGEQQQGAGFGSDESQLAENVQEELVLAPTSTQLKLSAGIVDFYI